MRMGLLFGFLGACACAPGGHDGRHLSDVRSAVGHVEVVTTEGGGQCSGFAVAPGLAMTAAHCLTGEAERSYDGRAAEVVSYDEGVDLGLLRVEGLDGPTLSVSGHDPEFGDPVDAVGYPAGVFLDVTGRWSGRDRNGGGVLAMTSYFGASGSAVTDAGGALVCVLVAIRTDYKGAAFCVPQDRVRAFLFKRGISFRRG